MTSADCTRIQSSFSAYLDGAVNGQQMQEIARHLETCGHCAGEFDSLRAVQQSLAVLGPAKAPADLGMKLRLAISHERVAMAFVVAAADEPAWALPIDRTDIPFRVDAATGAED